MTILSDLKMYSRFIRGLRGFLRHTISLDEAKAIIRQRMSDRESNFLRLVKKGIFGYPQSPYLPLLKFAGCEYGDIENMVRDKGLEGTLRTLREEGIYVTFEEFKGRQPIVRKNQVTFVQDHDFDNPFLSYYYLGETGGTTGVGSRVVIELDHLAAQAPLIMLSFDAHQVLNVPMGIWHGILPDASGINNVLRCVRFGNIPQKWFSPISPQDLRLSLKNRLATQYIVLMGRWWGVPIPWPERVRLDQAAVVARWAAKTAQVYGTCLIRTLVSTSMRMGIAAQEEGLDLTGVTLIGGGESPTSAKVNEILRTGARWIPVYPFSEAGHAGVGCVNPVDFNDIHFYKDILALIQYPRQVPDIGINVDAFYFTTLLPTAPKLMLNVESDDYGIIEKRACGCPLESYGFTDHLRHIHSFRKLTGEGVTLIGSEMVRILEEVLPSAFGGSPLDYQLLEEEDEKGYTRLSLIVSPKIKITDEKVVIDTVLESLGNGSDSADLARAIWTQAKTLQVKRVNPIQTTRGKQMPLYVLKSSGSSR
jgi:hypothetical protein